MHWFRRDLRLADNPSLISAITEAHDDGAGVVPLFVLDPHLWDRAGPNRQSHLARSLAALNASMDGALVIRYGSPDSVIPDVVREVQATAVHASASFEPYGHHRDDAVAGHLDELCVRFRVTGSPYAISPGRVLKADRTPYQVFTPFHRAWLDHGWRGPISASDGAPWASVASDDIPATPTTRASLPAAGEDAARTRWERFLVDGLATYPTDRDVPALSTSGVSVALKWGEIHPRTLLHDLAIIGVEHAPSTSVEAFRRQLAWRDFHADVLHHHPRGRSESLRVLLPEDSWATGPAESAAMDAWTTGRTGFPFVDAGMRELLATGSMHNRLRMVVASFLVKDLHVRWQRGAAYFMEHLVDGDTAQNQLNWQWVAGTGRDAAPYFRVFNPVTQGVRFDPDGSYIRRWIPELRHLAGKSIHEPWKASGDLFDTTPLGEPVYPERIVDHGVERRVTLDDLARGRDSAPSHTSHTSH